tara:strand:+ start:1121 stop:1318 length:198 start_codon:yes stop_codon:yes gene_type:complete
MTHLMGMYDEIEFEELSKSGVVMIIIPDFTIYINPYGDSNWWSDADPPGSLRTVPFDAWENGNEL